MNEQATRGASKSNEQRGVPKVEVKKLSDIDLKISLSSEDVSGDSGRALLSKLVDFLNNCDDLQQLADLSKWVDAQLSGFNLFYDENKIAIKKLFAEDNDVEAEKRLSLHAEKGTTKIALDTIKVSLGSKITELEKSAPVTELVLAAKLLFFAENPTSEVALELAKVLLRATQRNSGGGGAEADHEPDELEDDIGEPPLDELGNLVGDDKKSVRKLGDLSIGETVQYDITKLDDLSGSTGRMERAHRWINNMPGLRRSQSKDLRNELTIYKEVTAWFVASKFDREGRGGKLVPMTELRLRESIKRFVESDLDESGSRRLPDDDVVAIQAFAEFYKQHCEENGVKLELRQDFKEIEPDDEKFVLEMASQLKKNRDIPPRGTKYDIGLIEQYLQNHEQLFTGTFGEKATRINAKKEVGGATVPTSSLQQGGENSSGHITEIHRRKRLISPSAGVAPTQDLTSPLQTGDEGPALRGAIPQSVESDASQVPNKADLMKRLEITTEDLDTAVKDKETDDTVLEYYYEHITDVIAVLHTKEEKKKNVDNPVEKLALIALLATDEKENLALVAKYVKERLQ